MPISWYSRLRFLAEVIAIGFTITIPKSRLNCRNPFSFFQIVSFQAILPPPVVFFFPGTYRQSVYLYNPKETFHFMVNACVLLTGSSISLFSISDEP